MRIGDILRKRGFVDATSLERAIAEQRHAARRLCSLLIARGLLDPDHAAMALSEQHGVPAALSKYLDGRDPAVVSRLPAHLARACNALPIGLQRNGELVVAVSDPRRELRPVLEPAVGGAIVMAVAPMSRLAELIALAYGKDDPVEHGVDVEFESTGPIHLPPALDPLSVDAPTFRLVALDDARVSKDPTQSGAYAIPTQRPSAQTLPPVASAPPARPSQSTLPPRMPSSSSPPENVAAAPVPTAPAVATGSGSVEAVTDAPTQPPKSAPTLDETAVRLDRVTTRDAATDAAMAYLHGRYKASVLFTIKDGVAIGHRGHGGTTQQIDAIAFPTSAASLIKVVLDTGHSSSASPAGVVQERLSRLLGNPIIPAAAPVPIGGRIVGAIVVGDPRARTSEDHDVEDLEWLGEALGLAYARLVLEAKKT